MNNLLLDTCALIWLANEGLELSPSAINSINESNLVYVSSITAWEVSLLAARNQIELSCTTRDWFQALVENSDIKVIDIDTNIAIKANELPWVHRDPADRLIIATAIINNLTIVTKDKNFKQYGVNTIN